MAKTLEELKADRQNAYQLMEELIHKAKWEQGGVLSQEQRDKYDAAEKIYDDAHGEIVVRETDVPRQQQLRKTHLDSGSPLQLSSASMPTMQSTGQGRTYRELFGLSKLDNSGFATAEDFFQAVHGSKGHHNPKLEALTHVEGVSSAGGFMVPEQFSAEILDASLESEIVRPRASIYPMTSDTRKIAGFDGNDHTSGTLFGGFTAKWKPELGEGTEQTAKVRLIEMHARKLFLYTKISSELLQDGGSFGELLGKNLIAATGFFLDDAFLTGDGAGRPLGVLNDPALITVEAEVGQPAATLVYANLVKMFARMYSAGLSKAIWVANPTMQPALLQMAIPLGTGASHIPVMTRGAGGYEILGRPVVFTEKLPTLGTVGDILFADFSQYAVGMRKQVSVEQSMHVAFATDEIAYRAILRADGQGKWARVLTPKNGDTQSWAVVLETRA